LAGEGIAARSHQRVAFSLASSDIYPVNERRLQASPSIHPLTPIKLGRIPTQIVDQIYAAIDIVDVISDYVQLKKKGANHWALSPFVAEKSPSFAVNPVKGIYKDFSSGKGGNAINFLMEMEGFSYVEALKHLARKYGVEIEEEEETEADRVQRDQRESLFIVNEWAARWFHEQLLQTDEGKRIGLSYFKERGLLQTTIEQFQLGYSPAAWEALAQAAQQAQHQEAYLQTLGLVSHSEKTGKVYDRFRERVIFPIANPVGKIVGFGGRILSNRKDVGKYINSSESEVYHKSQVLYAMHLAKKAIRDQDLCLLTEGYMDVVLLHQNGIKNVVASSGTALTVEQIRLIKRFTTNVLMIYDGDAAGVKAANRGIDLLLKAEMSAKVLILPDNHDPDSFVRQEGAQGFLDFAEKEALSFLDFKMRVLTEGQDQSNPEVQAALIKGLAETVALVPDLVQRQMYIRHVAQKVEITESLMTHAVEESLRVVNKQAQQEQRREQARIQREEGGEVKALKTFEQLELAQQEKELLRIMVSHSDKSFTEEDGPLEDDEGNPISYEQTMLMDYLIDELDGLTFENQTYQQLREQMCEEFDAQDRVNLNRYLNHPDPAITRLVSGLLTHQETSELWNKISLPIHYDSDLRRVVEGAVYHYKARKVEKLLRECRDQLKEAQSKGDEAAMDQQLESNIVLMQMRRQIHAKLGTEGAIRGGDGKL
jgi:DNA primase